MKIYQVFTGAFVFALAFFVAVGVSSADDASRSDPEKIAETMKADVNPAAKRLSKMMLAISPKKDGKVFPVTANFQPFVPVDPGHVQRVSFHCPWGAQICEPFLRACASLQQSCSCSDHGSIDPDPC